VGTNGKIGAVYHVRRRRSLPMGKSMERTSAQPFLVAAWDRPSAGKSLPIGGLKCSGKGGKRKKLCRKKVPTAANPPLYFPGNLEKQ
jgi:hypothetical protein